VSRPRASKSPNSAYSSGTWPAADAHDEPAARECVEGGELLRGAQRMALGEHQDMGQQAHVARHPGQPTERGHGVVPDGAHGLGQPLGDGRVVADPDVEEPGRLGGEGGPGQLVGADLSPTRRRRATTGSGSAAAGRRRRCLGTCGPRRPVRRALRSWSPCSTVRWSASPRIECPDRPAHESKSRLYSLMALPRSTL